MYTNAWWVHYNPLSFLPNHVTKYPDVTLLILSGPRGIWFNQSVFKKKHLDGPLVHTSITHGNMHAVASDNMHSRHEYLATMHLSIRDSRRHKVPLKCDIYANLYRLAN